jgi:RimJ/RimL family protein N-acetyltransferase
MNSSPSEEDIAAALLVPPTIKGFSMRALVPSDAAALTEAVLDSVDSVGKWMAWCHAGYSLDDALKTIERNQQNQAELKAFEFGIFELESQQFAVACGINNVVWPNGTANLGYWMRERFAGRGIASLATRSLAGFGFRLGLTRIEIVAAEHNIASRRVAEKSGARLEAILRNRVKVDGLPVPGALYALFPD